MNLKKIRSEDLIFSNEIEDEQPIPYFEYYDGEDTHRYYLDESEQMMTDIRNFLNN